MRQADNKLPVVTKRALEIRQSARGFSLIELLVATAVFTVIAGTAFSLFAQHVSIAASQQNLSGVNIGLRNAMSQLEGDLAAASQNLLSTVQIPGVQPFGLGVIIQNNVPGVAATCAPNTTTWSYPSPSACFDSFTILFPKACSLAGGTYAPVLTISNANKGTDLVVNSIMFAADPNAGANLTNDSSCYTTGDEVLVLQPNNTSNCGGATNSNYCMSAVALTKDGSLAGGKIQLQHNPTGAGGAASNCPGSGCTDPLGVIFNSSGGSNYTNALGQKFGDGAYIIDLGQGGNDITYAVQANPSNAVDLQLVRCAGTSCTSTNAQSVTDQVVGFKVGAALWDNKQSGATDIANYFYNSANYCNSALSGADCTATPPTANDPNDFSLIRAVRISMIGRTPPTNNPTFGQFKNGFDSGPYLVQQASVVVDLRGMSLNEFGN